MRALSTFEDLREKDAGSVEERPASARAARTAVAGSGLGETWGRSSFSGFSRSGACSRKLRPEVVEARGRQSAHRAPPPPSLSSDSHNSDSTAVEQKDDLPFRLTGSQRKTAYALRTNVEQMIAEEGIHRIAFLTLTVGDDRPSGFRQVFDVSEASRRINNLSRRVLPALFSRCVVVTERHKNAAIHFHIIGALVSSADIRTGFDFTSFHASLRARAAGNPEPGAEAAYVASAREELRDGWRMLRETLPRYGFGRAQLTPIEKTGGAVACYVSKYVEKNLFNRLEEDYRKKLVRYIGWGKAQLKPNEFSWATARAGAWRSKAAALAELVGIDTREEMREACGPRWAFHVSRVMQVIDDPSSANADWSPVEREVAFVFMRRLAAQWCREKFRASNHPHEVKKAEAAWDAWRLESSTPLEVAA